jgi:iron complex transport system ATP-binding protein
MKLIAHSLGVRTSGADILRNVSFGTHAGEFIGIVGPNGAGKSTLLRSLAGLIRPNAGTATIDGACVVAMAPRERARRLAYLPQAREAHWAMTAEAIVALGRFAFGAPHKLGVDDRAAVERALGACDAAPFRDRIITTLSGGEQARVHVARAFAAETPILLADEPTAALDLKHALSIAAILRGKADAGGLVIAALHDLSLARRHCTRIIALGDGAVVADGPPLATLDDDLAARLFGVVADGAFWRLSD